MSRKPTRKRAAKSSAKPAEKSFDPAGIKKVADIEHPMSIVIYGRAGSGKTTLASTFPKPALLIDCRDKGTESVSDVEGLDVYQAEDWDSFELLYWYIKRNPGKYKTIIIDTMSQLQQMVIEKVLSEKKKNTERAGEWGTMTQKEWGDVASHMKVWVIALRDLPLNVVMLAQDRVFNMDEEDITDNMLQPEVGPRLSPSVVSQLNAAVSIIGNTYIRREEVTKKVKTKQGIKTKVTETIDYCLRIGPHPVYTTKIRKPKGVELPDTILDPTYQKLVAITRGK